MCQRCERPICPDCMRSASVGFQCPSCVSEGARQTRSGRAPYGGSISRNPALTSQVLIGINAAVWIAILATGWHRSEWVLRLALHAEGFCGAGEGRYWPGVSEQSCAADFQGTWLPGVADGAPWQLVTSMFTHVEIWHLAVNMLTLWFLGPELERVLGRARFLALYFLSGLGGSALVYLASAPDSYTLGASGAGFGLMAALLVVAYKVKGNYPEILKWVALNAVVTIVWSRYISWQGHLGGFVSGLLLMALLVYAPRARRTPLQVAGLAAFGVLLAAVVVTRTLTLT